MKIDTNHFNTLERLKKANPTDRVDIAVGFIHQVFGDVLRYHPRMTPNAVVRSLDGLKISWDKLCSHNLPVTDCGEYVLDEIVVVESLTALILDSHETKSDLGELVMMLTQVFKKLGWGTEPIVEYLKENENKSTNRLT